MSFSVPRLDRGPRQDDPRNLVAVETGDGHGHRQIRLPRTGWPHREYHVALAHQVDVAPLGEILRGDPSPCTDVGQHVLVHVLKVHIGLLRHDANGFPDVSGIHRIPGAEHTVELLQHLSRDPHLRGRSDQSHLVAARACVDGELALEDSQRAIVLAVQRCGGGVVVEDEGLASGGVVLGQGSLWDFRWGVARRTAPSTLRREKDDAVFSVHGIVGAARGGRQRLGLEQTL
jgi:hypothetical protein